MNTRFEFEPNFPTDLLHSVAGLLKRYEWLVPLWCQRILVRFRGDSEDGEDADCTTRKDYRWSVITIRGNFLEETERGRRISIVHELVHIPTTRVFSYAADTVDLLFKDGDAPKFHQHIKDGLREHYEAGVQDLAERIIAFEDSIAPFLGYIQ